jgi:hypothetical protein
MVTAIRQVNSSASLSFFNFGRSLGFSLVNQFQSSIHLYWTYSKTMAILSKPLTIITALAALVVPALSAPAPGNNIFERQNGFTPVLGPVQGGVQPRLEIRTLAQNPDMWNLFLLALIRFQGVSQDAKLSYFQIAGMHAE